MDRESQEPRSHSPTWPPGLYVGSARSLVLDRTSYSFRDVGEWLRAYRRAASTVILLVVCAFSFGYGLTQRLCNVDCQVSRVRLAGVLTQREPAAPRRLHTSLADGSVRVIAPLPAAALDPSALLHVTPAQQRASGDHSPAKLVDQGIAAVDVLSQRQQLSAADSGEQRFRAGRIRARRQRLSAAVVGERRSGAAGEGRSGAAGERRLGADQVLSRAARVEPVLPGATVEPLLAAATREAPLAAANARENDAQQSSGRARGMSNDVGGVVARIVVPDSALSAAREQTLAITSALASASDRGRSATVSQPLKAADASAPVSRKVAVIEAVEVQGSLPQSVVNRGLSRLLPQYERCSNMCDSEPQRLQLSTLIDESGHGRSVVVEGASLPGLQRCLEQATARLAVPAPDTGTARARWVVSFVSTAR